MNCPRCESTVLAEFDRDGVTIDRCAKCRGIWLDRGELEKLIARSGGDERDDDRGVRPRHDSEDGIAERFDGDQPRRGRKRSFLDIFDFD